MEEGGELFCFPVDSLPRPSLSFFTFRVTGVAMTGFEVLVCVTNLKGIRSVDVGYEEEDDVTSLTSDVTNVMMSCAAAAGETC